MKYVSKLRFDGQTDLLYVKDNSAAKIVTPEEYGAKGDGVTDDTEAIQTMFDTAKSGVIVFNSSKEYIVSDMITINGGYVTLTVLLGALKYVGANSNEKAVIFVTRTSNTRTNMGAGSVKIYGGYINCNRSIGTGIRLDSYGCCVDGLRVDNYNKYGIDLSHDYEGTTSISMQAKVSNCYINNYEYDEIGTSIRCVHADNNLSNVVTNRSDTSIELVYGGNYFSNCHFTISSRTVESVSDNIYTFIYNNPRNGTNNQINSFSNCYFNGSRARYIIKNEITNNISIKMEGCNIILGHTDYACSTYFMNSYDSPIQVDNLGIRKSNIHKFYGNVSHNGQSLAVFRNNMTVDTFGNKTQNEFDITNLDERPVPFITPTRGLPSHCLRRIAQVTENSSYPSMSNVSCLYNGRNRFDLMTSINATKLVNIVGSNLGYLKFYKDATSKITYVDGEGVRYYNIYAYNEGDNDIIHYSLCWSHNDQFSYGQTFVCYGDDNDIITTDLSNYTEITS